jgi:hypothetical protein
LFEGLDESRKADIITDGSRAAKGQGPLRGITVGSRSLPAREKTKARSRSYSGVLYEYRVERSRATRGATQVWVVAPGARRRVFYFAAVIRGSGEWKKFPQGISEASRRATKARSKIPENWGRAGRQDRVTRSIKSRQTRPETFRAFRSTRIKGSLTTERLASPRR